MVKNIEEFLEYRKHAIRIDRERADEAIAQGTRSKQGTSSGAPGYLQVQSH